VLLLTHALRERGHEPLLVGVPHAPLVERAHADGLATAAVTMRNDWDLRSSKRIRALVRTWRPDIVHAHDARAHAIALLALSGGLAPLVVTRRVTFSLKSVRFKYGPRVARFIAISHAVQRAMVESGVDASRIDVVHSGVPTPVVTAPRDWRAERGWDAASLVVGVVGAMTSEKGIDAAAAIARALPPNQARRTKLVFLGGDATGAVQFGLVEGYRAGFVTDIYNAMAGLDLLWHPAISEGLGTSVIDALALGVPPIAFAVGGIPEIVEHGVQGMLAPPGDISAFAQAHGLALDESVRSRLALAGPPRAALFSVDAMTEKTERVYQTVLTT
jgi:glycosyltransferase involved in cell wall biosynthesis